MAATTNINSVPLSQSQGVLTVPTHITETTKILKDNGETVEIVTVTLGSPDSHLKSGKSITFAAKTVAVSETDEVEKPAASTAITTNSSLDNNTANQNEDGQLEADNIIITNVGSVGSDNGITLLSSNPLGTVLVEDSQSAISENGGNTPGQFIQVVDGTSEEGMIVQSGRNLNGESY